MPLLTIFTPTYNRAHLLGRTYESLCNQTCKDFEWLVIDDGSTDETRQLIQGFINEGRIMMRYIYKENGGLYTGYNTAYANITTELSVCVDSDDFMPKDAVELIREKWRKEGAEKYCGIVGLDYDWKKKTPIGGKFSPTLSECYLSEIYVRHIHCGDKKEVMRTDLMKKVAPQLGFTGEKDFNPSYMLTQVWDEYPMLVINENLCWVDYQTTDSMSAGIINQYFRSPRSFAKMRILNMKLQHNTLQNKIRNAIHYVAECRIAGERHWLRHSPLRFITLLACPAGTVLYYYLCWKHRNQQQ